MFPSILHECQTRKLSNGDNGEDDVNDPQLEDSESKDEENISHENSLPVSQHLPIFGSGKQYTYLIQEIFLINNLC